MRCYKHEWLGEFEFVLLLSIINLDNNATGKEIHKKLNDSGRDVELPTIYSSINRALNKKYVDYELNGRNVRVYSVSEIGKKLIEKYRKLIRKIENNE